MLLTNKPTSKQTNPQANKQTLPKTYNLLGGDNKIISYHKNTSIYYHGTKEQVFLFSKRLYFLLLIPNFFKEVISLLSLFYSLHSKSAQIIKGNPFIRYDNCMQYTSYVTTHGLPVSASCVRNTLFKITTSVAQLLLV